MNDNNIVSIDYKGNAAGAIVFWRMYGTTPQASLAAALPEGLKGPQTPDAPTCLRRAVTDLRSDEFDLVRPIARRGDFAFLREARPEEGRVEITQVGRAYLEGETMYTSGLEAETSMELGRLYSEHYRTLSSEDVSSWLIGLMRTLGGVRLRESGGIYFIPRTAMATWDAVTQALHETTDHVLHQIPALKTEEAADAIMDALTREVRVSVEELEKELDSLGKRALANRGKAVDGLARKVSQYEELLGRSLEGVNAILDRAEATIGAALLAAEGEEAA